MAAAVAMYVCLVVFSGLTAYEASKELSSLVNGRVGATVYLNPTLSIPETYQQINWWFNDSLKILIKKLNQPASYPSDYFNENKLHYHGNRTLEIRQLQKQDSSIYKMDVEDSQGRTEKENIQLDVYEPVPEPSVEVDFRANQDGWCNVTLVCNVDATQVAYSWYQDGKYYMVTK
nr:CD48 antigen-like [Pelodiscus sinensis]|eukprot:XP_014434383.1 CD48 antigen-like [Pelodiscus sinensis]